MLILTRKKNESIIINRNIEIQVIAIEDGKVKLGISAPKDVEIHRSEILERITESNKEAVVQKDIRNLLSEKIIKKNQD